MGYLVGIAVGLMLWSGTGAEAYASETAVRDQSIAMQKEPLTFRESGRFNEMGSRIAEYDARWWGVVEKNQRVYTDAVSALHESYSNVFRPRSVDDASMFNQTRHQPRTVLLFVLVFLLASVPFFGWLIWKESNSKVGLAQSNLRELEKELVAVRDELNEAKEGLTGMEAGLAEQKERQVRYFREMFEQLGRFYERYSALPSADKSRVSLPEKVSVLLAAISPDEKACQLFEEELDFAYDGIMSRFRKDFPDLSGEDYREVSYLMCGFDTVTLMHVLPVNSKDAVYMRKYRLRKMIRSSASPFKDDYLSLLK